MIVRKLDEIEATDRDVAWGNGRSRRFLLARDGMRYSLTDTVVEAGSESLLEYRRHLEACYCVEGEGEVEVDGATHRIAPGTMYALDQHDKHVLRAFTRMRLVCVFYPPLEGPETHHLADDARAGAGSSY